MGRPPVTTHAELERVGIRLFTEHGYVQTSVDDIVNAVGISRRTFFRYFPSKADVVWGDFDAAVACMRAHLDALPDKLSLMEALRQAVVRFNTVPPSEAAHHRRRMTLILCVPELVAHSTLRYTQWRTVIEQYAARRLGQEPDDLLPTTIGHCALGAAVAAYRRWLHEDYGDLTRFVEQAYRALAVGFQATVTDSEARR